jgi:hypothetical protein
VDLLPLCRVAGSPIIRWNIFTFNAMQFYLDTDPDNLTDNIVLSSALCSGTNISRHMQATRLGMHLRLESCPIFILEAWYIASGSSSLFIESHILALPEIK